MNATGIVLAQAELSLGSLLVWGIALAAAGIALRLAPQRAWRKLGSPFGFVGLVVVGMSLPPLGDTLAQVLFWIMATVAVIGSGAAITSRSPVYAAIWFAVSLLGTAGLFLLQGAQFLGVATIVVYAGAIVVTFLFVIMLAQPEGHATYDRISWAGLATPVSILSVALLLGMLMSSLPDLPMQPRPEDIVHEAHVAKLGAQLFARHLVAVEVAGTILLVALVGAVAIVIQGKTKRRSAAEGGFGS